MERISEDDVDCFLQQMGQVFAVPQEEEKLQEEWRHFSGFTMWIPKIFHLADKETAEEIFWSEELPDTVFLAEGTAAGITLQKTADINTADPVGDIRQLLEKLDDRTVCYDAGEEGDRPKVYWLEYKSFAADGRIYNVLFVFQAGQDWVLGTFCCPFEDYGQWKAAIWEIMRTIKENIDEGI